MSVFFACSTLFSQTETWKMQDYSIGQHVAGFPGGIANTIPTMSEVIQLPNTTYRMYFNSQWNMGDKHCISYAESPDAINWTVIDTSFCGSEDTLQRNYIIGGPSIVKLSSGQYRMYYRCTQKYPSGATPQYHVRSAISNDGINFTQEGIRIDIKPFLSTSPFYLVGHGSYYKLTDGTFAGIFSANPDTSTLSAPSSLIHGTSADGLTWGNYTFLYQNHHDPVVIEKSGSYYMYAMNLAKYMVKAVSTDGLTWPVSADSVNFVDTLNLPMLIGGTKKIGDVGGIVMPDNDIFLYTNYGTTTGPSRDIIRFELQNLTTQLSEVNSSHETITLFPNPSNGRFQLAINNKKLSKGELEIYNVFGENVFQSAISEFNNATIDLSSVSAGIYVVKFYSGEKLYMNKIIIQK